MNRNLEHCKRMEEYVINTYPRWKKSRNPIERKSCWMVGIHDELFKVSLLNKQFSGEISQAALDQLFENPAIPLSKDHDIKRKFVAENVFKNFKKLKFTGDGNTMLKIIREQTFSYVTKSENHSTYDVNKIVKVSISDKMKRGIDKYQYYAKRNPDWFKTRKITNLLDFEKLPISNLKFKTEDELFRWIGTGTKITKVINKVKKVTKPKK